jgi:hypothetical protein
VQTTVPDESPAPQQVLAPARPEPPPPPQPDQLACGVPGTANGIVSNLERIPFRVILFGERARRPQILEFAPGGAPSIGGITITAKTVTNAPATLPIKVSATNGQSDSSSTRMSMLLEVPVPESYAARSVDDYLTALLSGRVTTPGGNDQTLQRLRQDRATAAAAMRALFFENLVGYTDVVCTYQPPRGLPGTPLTATARLNVVSRGKFFEQPSFGGRLPP